MEINFKANLIDKTHVMKRGIFNKKYSPKEVALVKFDIKSPDDIKTLKKLKNFWFCSLAGQIYYDTKHHPELIEVFALTTQNDKFEKLNHKKILGIAEIIDNKASVSLEYLQTHPKYEYDKDRKTSKFIGIGKAFLNWFKSVENVRQITLNPLFSSIPFYEKAGFMEDPDNSGILFWKKVEKDSPNI